MHDLILSINTYSGIIAMVALFIVIVIRIVKLFAKKALNLWLEKITKPALYVMLGALFIHIAFTIRLAIK